MQSEQINELASALAKAQAEMASAKKDSINPHFKSKYADLTSVWDACRAPLTKNGLAVAQTFSTVGGNIQISTVLLHTSGQWISSSLPIPTADPRPQVIGSAISYMRRYALSALVGVVADDDDAEATENRRPPEPPKAVKYGPTIPAPPIPATAKVIPPIPSQAREFLDKLKGEAIGKSVPKPEPEVTSAEVSPDEVFPFEVTASTIVPLGQFKGRTFGEKSRTEWQVYLSHIEAKMSEPNVSPAVATNGKKLIAMVEAYLLNRPASQLG